MAEAAPIWDPDDDHYLFNVVISQSVARRLWPGQDPVGQRAVLWAEPATVGTVIGVVADMRERGLEEGPSAAVYLSYAEFVSTTIQRPVVRQVLPVEPVCAAPGESNEYIYEPGPEAVLGALLPRFIESEIYHAILESIASEQSAKVVAMRNATENAGELIESLTLAYNKARQESITTELLEIVGGAAAV